MPDPRHCQKIRYWRRVDALIALAKSEAAAKTHRYQGAKANRREELRVYRCDVCHGRPWHLSSVPA